jgi:hypothetical protein
MNRFFLCQGLDCMRNFVRVQADSLPPRSDNGSEFGLTGRIGLVVPARVERESWSLLGGLNEVYSSGGHGFGTGPDRSNVDEQGSAAFG